MPKLTIKVVNKSNESVEVDWDQSAVKVKGGTWKAIGGGVQTCTPNATVSKVDDVLFGLGASRRYRIHIERNDNDADTYYPSPLGYTDDSTPVINVTG